mgnify:CR=1 FL=1
MRKFSLFVLVLSTLFLQAHTDHYKNYNTRERIYDDVYAIIESNQSTRAREKKESDKKRALRIIRVIITNNNTRMVI